MYRLLGIAIENGNRSASPTYNSLQQQSFRRSRATDKLKSAAQLPESDADLRTVFLENEEKPLA
ncbi:hypothetical protein FJ970_33490 (plasmid) [Mesorhizobium sp. B2-1-8]|uniref:hypothetical protein n=1 Tax=Mesorhizobium sp. B2-1-8 TaxID=2589967 RepID=UPI001128CF43|nr:hypothetical protein [Mesorhizobium sp. B2-1-8]UCI22824.1 hypothetical protein FJ970_33490 [Mesorhizobium sp. B2-1-8]